MKKLFLFTIFSVFTFSEYKIEKNQVFYYENDHLVLLDHADARSFIILDNNYAKDENGGYFLSKRLENSDSKSSLTS